MEKDILDPKTKKEKALKSINSVIASGYFAMAAAVVIAIVFVLNKRGVLHAPGVPDPGTAMALFTAGYAATGFKALLDLLGIEQVPKES